LNQILRRHAVQVGGIDGPPLVFANGFGCDQNVWRAVAPAFEASHRVVRFDYAGAGGADATAWNRERHGSLHGYARDLLDVLEALNLPPATVVGHSAGATIAALAANAAPARIARLALVAPSPCYIDDPPDYLGGFSRADIDGLLDLMDRNYLGWAATMAPVITKNQDQPQVAAELERNFCSTDPVIARCFAEATFLGDHRADLARVAQPALVLQCRDDAIAPTTVGDWLARRMPRATLHPLAATGHCPHMSHPAETVAAIRDWLATAAAGT
jgi:sigma-B regulation protein RsbQ